MLLWSEDWRHEDLIFTESTRGTTPMPLVTAVPDASDSRIRNEMRCALLADAVLMNLLMNLSTRLS